MGYAILKPKLSAQLFSYSLENMSALVTRTRKLKANTFHLLNYPINSSRPQEETCTSDAATAAVAAAAVGETLKILLNLVYNKFIS